MGFFIHRKDKHAYVDVDGRVYNNVDKQIELDPKTFKALKDKPVKCEKCSFIASDELELKNHTFCTHNQPSIKEVFYY